jgi:DNA repair exonuclease SbcCD ATPase subunit
LKKQKGILDMIKINKFEIENVKRVKAVRVKPTENGLTVIGGANGQGKTSILDAIAWALGGEKFKPSQAAREGSALPPHLKITMSNGLIVERAGKNSALKVTDPSGEKAGQMLLDTFIEKLALDLPKFMQSSGKEKANTLLRIIGVEDQLIELEEREKALYQERLTIGRIADQKDKFAKEQPYFPEAPNEPVSAAELIKQQQEILARNGENQRKRDHALELHAERNRLAEKVNTLTEELERYQKQLIQVDHDMNIAYKSAKDLQDESTSELEESIANIDEINRKVRANLDKEKAEDDAKAYKDKYKEMSDMLDDVRNEKMDLLNSAKLPLPELSIDGHELTYKGQKWDNMSGSEQLKVATAIIKQLNPECGFVLMDKLEQMDLNTMKEFGSWLEEQSLQVIATRVSTGDECSIIIEDGYVKDAAEPEPALKDWRDF